MARAGVAVVVYKGHEQVVQDKGGRQTKDGAQIGIAENKGVLIRPQPDRELPGEQQPDQRAGRPCRQRAPERQAEHAGRFPILPPGTQDGIPGGAAYAEQQPGAIHQAEHAHGQIHRRQTFRPQLVRHKDRVGQNSPRRAQHPQNAQRTVSPELPVSPLHTKRPPFPRKPKRKRRPNAPLLGSTGCIQAPCGIGSDDPIRGLFINF